MGKPRSRAPRGHPLHRTAPHRLPCPLSCPASGRSLRSLSGALPSSPTSYTTNVLLSISLRQRTFGFHFEFAGFHKDVFTCPVVICVCVCNTPNMQLDQMILRQQGGEPWLPPAGPPCALETLESFISIFSLTSASALLVLVKVHLLASFSPTVRFPVRT